MTTSETPSQPESLLADLAYDDWEGLFEFVGPLNVQTDDGEQDCNSSNEDLNLSVYVPNDQPILIDEETFLSLQPSDFVVDCCDTNSINDDNESLTTSPPLQSGYFIENALHDLKQIDTIKNTKDTFNNKFTAAKLNNQKTVPVLFSAEEITNLKNKLISNGYDLNELSLNDNNMNGFTADLCDNLSEQLEILQRQVTNLADSQNNVDDRTNRTKTEYAVLQAKYTMLEEQFREVELRSDERLSEEQKRHRELLARAEREAKLQNENCQYKIKTYELEATRLQEELQRCRVQCDKQAVDLHTTQEKLEIARDTLFQAEDELKEAKVNERKLLADKVAAEDLMIELGKEVERLRSECGPAMPSTSPETIRLEELHQELEHLRHAKKNLEEQNEELQAKILSHGVEEGRNLLNCTSNSLADELSEMDHKQLQLAYHDKEEENQRLKHYIDTILLNIVENYPQLLEVKTTTNRVKQ